MNPRLTRVRVALVRIGFAFGRRWPVRRRVVLATAHSDQISGNLAEIRRAVAARHPEIPIVVLASRPPIRRFEQVRGALEHVRAGWHLATARLFVVDDYYFPMYAIRPRPGTRFVQVWHACGAFKKFGYSVLDKAFGLDEDRAAELAIHTNYDLCLVSADRFTPFYAEAFRQPPARFTARLGIPRTDLFFDRPRIAAAAQAIRAQYGIPDGRRVLLYAPTFRGDRLEGASSPDVLDLAELRRVLGEDHVVLLRAHPFVVERARLGPSLAGFATDASDWPELNELMLVSDVLVTDYSSAIYEFALLGRPIVFLTPDHAAYEQERGFYLDVPADLPGPVFETTTALADHLRAGDFDLERVRRFGAASFDVADGRAASRFLDEIVVPTVLGG